MKRLLPVLFSLLFALTIGPNMTLGQSARSASAVTRVFYAKYLELNIRGLPDAVQLKTISPYISVVVTNLIKADLKKQKRYISKHPNNKPPWIEGDLFSSSYEGATAFTVGNTRPKGNTREVDVHLTFDDGTNKSKWTDTAILKHSAGKWVITNILYKGEWPFKSGTSLINVLK